MNFKSLLTLKALFEINRISIDSTDKFFLMLGGLFLVLAAIFKLSSVYAPSSVDKKYRGKLFTVFLTIGLLELVWFGARSQFVRFFGTKFVALLILVIGLVWFGAVLINMLKNYRKEKMEWEKEQVKLRYLPK